VLKDKEAVCLFLTIISIFIIWKTDWIGSVPGKPGKKQTVEETGYPD
jgi:hypothetical protein